ncbi:MAG: glycosyltransferase [Bacteroidales bacterium]|nr:glycosyltransferase [Bacteroidales bacterium]
MLKKIARGLILKIINGMIVTNSEVADWYTDRFPPRFIVFPIIRKEDGFGKELSDSLSQAGQYEKKYNLTNKKIFLYVGRFAHEKNLERLIEAFRIVYGTDKNTRLLLVGSGYMEQTLRDEVEKKRLNEAVILPGRFEGINLWAWYLIAGVFILPSSYERFGAVVNEALLAGCYSLVSNVAGSTCLIQDGVNGTMIDPSDIQDMVNKMLECLNKEFLFSQQGEIKNSRMLLHYEDAIASLVENFKK